MRGIHRITKNRRGFTLVELIVCLVILAILAAVSIPTMLGYVQKAKLTRIIANGRNAYLAAQTLASQEYALGWDDATSPGKVKTAMKSLGEYPGEAKPTFTNGKVDTTAAKPFEYTEDNTTVRLADGVWTQVEGGSPSGGSEPQKDYSDLSTVFDDMATSMKNASALINYTESKNVTNIYSTVTDGAVFEEANRLFVESLPAGLQSVISGKVYTIVSEQYNSFTNYKIILYAGKEDFQALDANSRVDVLVYDSKIRTPEQKNGSVGTIHVGNDAIRILSPTYW